MGKLFDEIAGSFNETAQDKSKAVQQNSSVKDLDAFFETRFGKRKKEEVEGTTKPATLFSPDEVKRKSLAEREHEATPYPDVDKSGELSLGRKLSIQSTKYQDDEAAKVINPDRPETWKTVEPVTKEEIATAQAELDKLKTDRDKARVEKHGEVLATEWGMGKSPFDLLPQESAVDRAIRNKVKAELKSELRTKNIDIPDKEITDDLVGEYYRQKDYLVGLTRRQGVGGAMTVAIAAPTIAAIVGGAAPLAIAATALKTVLGVSAFMGIDEAINATASKIAGKEHQWFSGKSATDILAPEDTSQAAKDLGWMAQLVASGILLKGGYEALKSAKNLRIAEKYYKDKLTVHSIKPEVTITPEQLREFHGNQRPEIISKEVSDLLKDLGLSRAEYVKALKNGLEVSFGAEKLIYLVDKPYFKKLKSILGIPSVPRLISKEEFARGYRMRPAGLIEAPKEGKQEGASAQPSPQPPVQPTPAEPRVETPAEVAKEQVRSIVAKTAETVLEKTDLGNRTAALSEALQEVNKLGLANSHGWNAIVAGRKDIATEDLADYYKREIEKLAKTVKPKTESDVPLNVGEQEKSKIDVVTGTKTPTTIEKLLKKGYTLEDLDQLIKDGTFEETVRALLETEKSGKTEAKKEAEKISGAPGGKSVTLDGMQDLANKVMKDLKTKDEFIAEAKKRTVLKELSKEDLETLWDAGHKKVTKETPLRLKPKKIEDKKTPLEGTTKYLGKDYKVGKTIPAGQTTGEGVNQKAAKDYDRVELLNPETGEAEVIVKASEISKPKYTVRQKDPFAFQDSNQETIVHASEADPEGRWDKGNTYRYVLEGTGDIFRELSLREEPDGGYIGEKLERIKRHLKNLKDLHPEDTIEYSREHNPDKFKRMIALWEKQPVETKEQEIARLLNIVMLKGNFSEAKILISKIKATRTPIKPSYLAKGNTAEFIPPVEKGTITLDTVKKQFPNAEVVQPGGENSPIYIKTPGDTYLTVENVASIAPDKRAFKIGYGREFNPETDFIPEQYVDGVLTFVRGEAGQWTLDHANMHMLEDLGLITAKEIDAFKQQAIKEINTGKRKSVNKEDIGGKEDRANIYAEMMGRRRRDKNFLEKIIDRVKDFLARLFNAFSNKAKVRNVTREAETGDIYKRTGTQAEKGTPQFLSKKKAADPKLLELKEYGEKLYNEGTTTYNDWLGKMKEYLGERYDKFKDSLREVYNDIVRKLSSERGSITEGENIFKGLGKDIVDAYKRTGKSLDKLLGEMSTRLGNIHPTLKSRIREFEYRKGKLEVGLKKKALESISAFRKMSPEDLKAFDMARKNSNGTELKRLVTKYHFGKEYHTLREIYTFLYTAAKEVGMAGGYTNNYHAREVKDLEGLRNFLYKTNDWSVYELAFQEYKLKKNIGRPLTQEEQIRIINTLLRGDSPSTITLLTPDQLKRRYIKEVTPEIDKFFSDSDSAFLRYITDMVEAIEARRFFGRGLKDTQDLENSIGAFVMRATIDKHITPAQSEELYQILHARFKQQGTHGIITAVKNIALVDTLGSVFSAIRQLGDYTWALYDFGLITTGKAAKGAWTGKSLITKEDAGISRIAVEFSDMSKTGKFVDWVFESKGTGFSFVDKTGKEMLLNGAFRDARKKLANPKTREAFIKELEVLVGDRAPQAAKEFEDNKVTYLTEFYSVCKLADYQPIWVSEMPEIYAKAGNARIFYMLKSFTLKMFDVFRREAFQKIKTPGQRTKGVKNLIKLATIFLLANAGASIIQDLLLGRDIEITDSITENIWQLFGLSRYFGYRVPQEGAGTALMMNILPPAKAVNAISKDIAEWGDGTGFRVTESIPFVGKIYYWRFGKGSMMMEKRKDKEAKSKASAERKANKVPNPSQYRFRSSKVPSPRDYRLK